MRKHIILLALVWPLVLMAASEKADVLPKPLFKAAKLGYLDDVRDFINNGGNVNAHFASGTQLTLLHSAILGRRLEVVQLLLANNASVHSPTSLGLTPLHYASNEGQPELVELLLKHGADVSAKDNGGRTALFRAIDPGPYRRRGGHFIYHATEDMYNKVVDVLLLNNADVNIADNNRVTPLMVAANQRKLDIVRLLIAKGAHVNALDKQQRHAAFYLVERSGDSDLQQRQYEQQILTLLIDGGINIQQVSDGLFGGNLLHRNCNPDMVKMLLAKGIAIDHSVDFQTTLLHSAVMTRGCQLDVIEVLLNAGFDVQAKDRRGRTALHLELGSSLQNPQIIKLLLEKTGNINASDKKGNTVLHSMIGNSQATWAVPALVDKGLDINAKNDQGYTALHQAVGDYRNLELVKALLKAGADPNVQAVDGRTTLHRVANSAKLTKLYLKLLLKKKARKDIADNKGWYPFHIAAASRDNSAVVKKLQTRKIRDIKVP